jgi:DNA (cytosine-5)-methyltransferase 1
VKYLSTFTGIGGFEIGIHNAIPHAECVGYSEVNQPAIKTYEEHYEHKNYGDITTIDAGVLPDFDLIVGGFPCQAFSVAGKRRGFDEARGTLFFDVARILEHKRPGHLVLENVKGLLNHDGGKTFTTILGILADLGYAVEWQVLNSKHFGVPQNRERVYIVGHLRERCSRQIFPFIGENDQPADAGDDAPRGSEKFIKTRHLSQNGGLISDSITLQASEIPHVVAGTINRGSFKETNGHALTITANYFKGHDNHGQRPMVKQIIPGASQKDRVYEGEGISPTLDIGKGGRLSPKIQVQAVARRGRQGGSQYEFRGDQVANTVRTATGGGSMGMIATDYQIRRLTPIECERLQGFPDGWTLGSDTQRYKQCGNAVTTNVVTAVMTALRSHL